MTGPALISLTEARRRLGVGPVALANLIREGHLRTRMVQGRKQARQLVVAASLQEWLDAGSPEPRMPKGFRVLHHAAHAAHIRAGGAFVLHTPRFCVSPPDGPEGATCGPAMSDRGDVSPPAPASRLEPT